jgi:hypothetical protein
MVFSPYFIQKYLTKKVTVLLAAQYQTACRLFGDPLENQEKIFTFLIGHWFYVKPNQQKETALLSRCTSLLDLHELIIELLDVEYGFNRLDLKRQVALEQFIMDTIEVEEMMYLYASQEDTTHL